MILSADLTKSTGDRADGGRRPMRRKCQVYRAGVMRAKSSLGSFTGAGRCSAQAGSQEAEFVVFGVGQDVPWLLAGLADVGRARPELQEAFEFGVLVAVGGVDVEVQP